MPVREHGRIKPAALLVALAVFLCLLSSCGYPAGRLEEEAGISHMLTIEPGIALDLTAWPSPPPILTSRPIPTAEPRVLWAAEPQSSAMPIATTPPGITTQETPVVEPAALGSLAPPVRLLIPILALDIPVLEVSWDVVWTGETWQSVWQTVENAVGHHRNSANPGEAGNVVISGHHNTKGEPFRLISEIGQPGAQIDVGDELVLIAQDDKQYRYTIVDWARFEEEGSSAAERQDHASFMDPTSDGTLTLITSWPYDSNTHRVVVIAKLTAQGAGG